MRIAEFSLFCLMAGSLISNSSQADCSSQYLTRHRGKLTSDYALITAGGLTAFVAVAILAENNVHPPGSNGAHIVRDVSAVASGALFGTLIGENAINRRHRAIASLLTEAQQKDASGNPPGPALRRFLEQIEHDSGHPVDANRLSEILATADRKNVFCDSTGTLWHLKAIREYAAVKLRDSHPVASDSPSSTPRGN